MKKILFDIETNGLLDELDVVHSLVILDIDTGKMVSCADHQDYTPITDGLELLAKAERLVGHNIQAFDLPALQKVYGFTYLGELHDTLVMSRLVWSDLKQNDFKFVKKNRDFPMKLIGSHSLGAWGHRLSNHKIEYSGGWAQWSEEMQTYCEGDIYTNLTLYEKIMSKEPSLDSIQLEHDFAAIIRKQEAHGFPFDVTKANALLAKLQSRKATLEAELQTAFPPWEIREPFIPKVNNKSRGYQKGVMTHKVKSVVFNPASRDHIANRLMTIHKWRPTDFTSNGKPKVDEDVLKKLDYPEAEALNEFLLLNKRIGQLAVGQNAWLKLVRNGRMHGQVITSGTATFRCTHMRPNISQTPSVNAPYGTECRELFHAPKGSKLVGADLSGLELRCLAHYMARFDDGSYSDEVVNGDVHTANQKAAGLPTRNNAKTFIYGFLYGAGAAKIGSIVGGSEAEGKKLISKFMKATPAIKMLREAVVRSVKTKGHLKGLDGRILPIRSDHSALNMLLQSAGSILCKRSTVILHENLTRLGYAFGKDYALVAHVHDEVQLITREEIAEIVGQQAVTAFEEAGAYYDFNCPITGEFKVGQTWADTH
jgi:DNA polymerase-1